MTGGENRHRRRDGKDCPDHEDGRGTGAAPSGWGRVRGGWGRVRDGWGRVRDGRRRVRDGRRRVRDGRRRVRCGPFAAPGPRTPAAVLRHRRAHLVLLRRVPGR
ncbi:hypothetical protein FJ693_19150 [Georgenia yuyongxinii]|uniref:Uncharacterized protein n=1 Tax=Georgenia yuyongxinii TaxID=2589797 RepID=A0A552WJY3_9MICO|nr:hypothetical protein FJ693_19150 [Georgenia yuyongxinii]